MRSDYSTDPVPLNLGKRVPIDAYLEQYPNVPLVIIIGDRKESGVTSPSSDHLENHEQWTTILKAPIDAVMAVEMVVYERINNNRSQENYGTIDIDSI